jgi:hypothetical protein
VTEGIKLHQIFTYPAPKGAPLKYDYDVFVRPRSSEQWTHIDTYMAKVNAPIGNNKHKVSEISYAFFDFTGDVFVKVVCKNKTFKTARIRPDYRGTICNIQNDSTIQFLLFQPENLSVEFDDNITDNLLLFTSKPAPSADEARREAETEGRNFIYYVPGYYTQDSIRVTSNTTVFLDGGSYFTGNFSIKNAENVSIIGRGIARPANGYRGAYIYNSNNVLIDGLILNTCPVGGSDGVTLHDVRSISYPGWGDGLNVFASSNVIYDRVFCRNSDDCTTAYASRKGFKGSVHNVRMRNSTLWADVAHPIFIGIHGNSAVGDSIVGLTYENIDILCQIGHLFREFDVLVMVFREFFLIKAHGGGSRSVISAGFDLDIFIQVYRFGAAGRKAERCHQGGRSHQNVANPGFHYLFFSFSFLGFFTLLQRWL